jgi:beta-lactamase class A
MTDMLAFLLAVAISIPHTDATVGYTAIDIESGRRVSQRGSDHFPMASVFKFPVAIVVLQRVDAGEFKLDDPITIQPSQFSRGHSPLRDSANGKAVTASVRGLVELMVVESDNTAVDYFIRCLGGANITARIHALGGAGIRIDRPENDIAAAIQGVAGQTSFLLRQSGTVWFHCPGSCRCRYSLQPGNELRLGQRLDSGNH